MIRSKRTVFPPSEEDYHATRKDELCRGRIGFRYLTLLRFDPHPKKEYPPWDCMAWFLNTTDFLIANTGAHYLKNDIYEYNLKSWLSELTKQNFTGHLIWRFTPPGHVNCSQFKEPFPNIEI